LGGPRRTSKLSTNRFNGSSVMGKKEGGGGAWGESMKDEIKGNGTPLAKGQTILPANVKGALRQGRGESCREPW